MPVIFKISFDNLVLLGVIGVVGVMAHGILDDDFHMHLEMPIGILFGIATIGGYAGFRYIDVKHEPTWLNKVLASFQSPKTIKGVFLKDKILKR